MSAEPIFSEQLNFKKGHIWDYERVTEHLRHNGAIKPYEWAGYPEYHKSGEGVGYPEYHNNHVQYIRYTPKRYEKYRILISSIRAGFETMLAKKRVGVLCRSLPQDCEQIIKESLLPIPRNRAFHLHY